MSGIAPTTRSRSNAVALSSGDAARTRFLLDPLAFMNDNVIVVTFEGADKDTLDDTPLDLCLIERSPQGGTASKLGKPLGLFAIGTAGFAICVANVKSVSAPFKAYFCPYRGGQTLGTVISNKADFMFTTQMDGCSLGIGMANSSGARLIYHSNVGGNVDAQQTQLTSKLGIGIETVWAPKSYRMEFGQAELCATTFGVRNKDSGQWKVYSQTYQRRYSNPDKFYLREVKTVL
jgi:hypothetical protein